MQMRRLHRSFPDGIRVDRGAADPFLAEPLYPGVFEAACAAVGQPLVLRRQRTFRFRSVRRLFGLLLLLGGVSGLLALSRIQFFRLTADKPTARIEVRQLAEDQHRHAGCGRQIARALRRSVADRRAGGALAPVRPDGWRAATDAGLKRLGWQAANAPRCAPASKRQ